MALPRGLLSDLERDEGNRPVVYDDATGEPITKGSVVKGFPTMFMGLRADLPWPAEIGKVASARAAEDRWGALVKALPWITNQHEDVQRALGNMVFQLGVTGVLGFPLMLSALIRGDRETAAVNALHSRWATQTPERAIRVCDLLRGYKE